MLSGSWSLHLRSLQEEYSKRLLIDPLRVVIPNNQGALLLHLSWYNLLQVARSEGLQYLMHVTNQEVAL